MDKQKKRAIVICIMAAMTALLTGCGKQEEKKIRRDTMFLWKNKPEGIIQLKIYRGEKIYCYSH